MAQAEEDTNADAGYRLEGTLLEACSCSVLCPCWIGEDPDLGYCYAVNSYHFDTGRIGGVDVAGMNLINVVRIPGNVLTPHSWEVVMLVDDRGSEEQRNAVVGAFRGEYGGPLADLAELVAEVKGVESVPITHQVVGGAGTLRVPGVVDAEMEPYRGPDGTVTTLRDSIFSTVPGSPAWVSRTSTYRIDLPQYDMVWDYDGRNAIQADYRIEFGG